ASPAGPWNPHSARILQSRCQWERLHRAPRTITDAHVAGATRRHLPQSASVRSDFGRISRAGRLGDGHVFPRRVITRDYNVPPANPCGRRIQAAMTSPLSGFVDRALDRVARAFRDATLGAREAVGAPLRPDLPDDEVPRLRRQI